MGRQNHDEYQVDLCSGEADSELEAGRVHGGMDSAPSIPSAWDCIVVPVPGTWVSRRQFSVAWTRLRFLHFDLLCSQYKDLRCIWFGTKQP